MNEWRIVRREVTSTRSQNGTNRSKYIVVVFDTEMNSGCNKHMNSKYETQNTQKIRYFKTYTSTHDQYTSEKLEYLQCMCKLFSRHKKQALCTKNKENYAAI